MRSVTIPPGIWQYEFIDGKIAVSRWDQPPTSTFQWVVIQPGRDGGYSRFYLEGTCNEDLRVTAVTFQGEKKDG